MHKRIHKWTAVIQLRRQRGGHLNCVQLGGSLLSAEFTYRVCTGVVWTNEHRHRCLNSNKLAQAHIRWHQWEETKQFEFFQNLYMRAKLLQSYPALCDPIDSQAPLSLGFLQASIPEWVAMPSSRGSSWPRNQTCYLLCLLHWQVGSLPPVPPGKPLQNVYLCYKCLHTHWLK